MGEVVSEYTAAMKQAKAIMERQKAHDDLTEGRRSYNELVLMSTQAPIPKTVTADMLPPGYNVMNAYRQVANRAYERRLDEEDYVRLFD